MRDNFRDSATMRQKPKQPPSRPKVTIAIGLISKPEAGKPGEIILACDSQTTYGKTKDVGSKKFTVVRFKNGKALFVHSGYVREGKMALQIIQQKAEQSDIENASSVIQEGMRECRADLLKGLQMTAEQEQAYLKSVEFQFLIAFYVAGQPFLLHADIHWGSVCPVENGSFSAIGEPAEDLARYLIKEYHKADPRFIHCDQIAVSIIEKVKQHIDGCGGLTRLGMVFPSAIENFHSQVSIYPDGTVNLLAHELERQEQAIAENRNGLMRQVIENTHRSLERKIKEGGAITVTFEP